MDLWYSSRGLGKQTLEGLSAGAHVYPCRKVTGTFVGPVAVLSCPFPGFLYCLLREL